MCWILGLKEHFRKKNHEHFPHFKFALMLLLLLLVILYCQQIYNNKYTFIPDKLFAHYNLNCGNYFIAF